MDLNKYIDALKELTTSEFEEKLLVAAIKCLDYKDNPLRFNNFACSIRELSRHILKSLAPDDEVRGRPWFKVADPGDPKMITRKQRIKYSIQKKLPETYIQKKIPIIDFLIKDVADTISKLNKYIHIEEETFDTTPAKEKELVEYVLTTFEKFLTAIKTSQAYIRELNLLIYILNHFMNKETLHLATPGEILLEEFIKPLGLKQKDVAQGLDIPESRLSEIIKGKLRINAEYALRLSLYFGMDEQTWMNLQHSFDRRLLESSKAREIRARIKPLRKRALDISA